MLKEGEKIDARRAKEIEREVSRLERHRLLCVVLCQTTIIRAENTSDNE